MPPKTLRTVPVLWSLAMSRRIVAGEAPTTASRSRTDANVRSLRKLSISRWRSDSFMIAVLIIFDHLCSAIITIRSE
jgi:hypothetical protein